RARARARSRCGRSWTSRSRRRRPRRRAEPRRRVTDTAAHARETAAALYRSESRRVLATLIRLLGDFDLAEEALHDAFTAALEQWPAAGIPSSPRAWLVSAGRFKAIDVIRRGARHDPRVTQVAGGVE